MRRAAKPKLLDEDDLHFAVADFLRLAWPLDLPWYHPPLGGNRGDHITRTDRRTGQTYTFSPSGARLKRMGSRAGVPDLVFQLPKGRVGYIELKIDNPGNLSELSDEQATFRREVIAAGAGYAVCWSVEEVEATLVGWLAIYGRTLRGRLQ